MNIRKAFTVTALTIGLTVTGAAAASAAGPPAEDAGTRGTRRVAVGEARAPATCDLDGDQVPDQLRDQLRDPDTTTVPTRDRSRRSLHTAAL